jgi:hypothetical protein
MRGVLTLAVASAAIAACSPFGGGAFSCDEDVQCGAGGQCEPNGFCSFPDPDCDSGRSYGEASGPLSGVCVGEEPPIDAPVTDFDARPIDAMNAPDATCIVDGFSLCTEAAVPALTFGTETLDTANDPRCVVRPQPGGGADMCLIYATAITVPAGATLTVIGGRPLALAASGTIQIDGTIDAGSTDGRTGPAADDGSCGSFGANPEVDGGGAGGGAGGSFAAAGGNGGEGDTDQSSGSPGTALPGTTNPAAGGTPGNLRGGCRGQTGGDEGGGGGSGDGGDPGSSGGAVWVLALGEVRVNGGGAIGVTGAGGEPGETQSGGGGGGSGGLIRIAAPAITIAGTLSAVGGGGGGGGARILSGPTYNITGSPGLAGPIGADGGTGGDGARCCPPGTGMEYGGHGGNGGGTAAAIAGGPSIVGAAGGGGSVGFIILVGPASVTGVASPAPIQL